MPVLPGHQYLAFGSQCHSGGRSWQLNYKIRINDYTVLPAAAIAARGEINMVADVFRR